MSILNKGLILSSLTKHETLTIDDICKEENLGMVPNGHHLKSLLNELKESGHLEVLNDVDPITYTITSKGIDETVRLENKRIARQNIL